MAEEASGKPKIVLVHGVWADGSSWAEVIKEIGHKGYQVQAAQLPLTSFEEDVAAATRAIQHVGGPVILVGHSYGGAVVTAAGNHPNVEKLVYITAFAPEAGQPFGAIMGENPPAAMIDLKPDADGFLWATAAMFQEAIAQDLHRGLSNLAAAVQKPYAVKLFETSLQEPAWRSKPSYYLVTTEDRVLNPKTQRALAEKMKAKVHEVAASHMVLLSKAEAVADIIVEAAG